jgi:hypothetical protein
MAKQLKYQCSICGKWHEGLSDIAFAKPDYYLGASEQQKKDGYVSDDVCIIPDGNARHFFVRGVLLVPILDTGENFGWGVWSSLSEKNFMRYVELKNDAAIRAEPSYFGWFSNHISIYPETLGLKCNVELQNAKLRPRIMLEPSDHPLSREQAQGITMQRAIAILSQLGHV